MRQLVLRDNSEVLRGLSAKAVMSELHQRCSLWRSSGVGVADIVVGSIYTFTSSSVNCLTTGQLLVQYRGQARVAGSADACEDV